MLGGIRNLALLVVISASLVSEGSFQAIQRKERSNDADSLLPLWFAGQRNGKVKVAENVYFLVRMSTLVCRYRQCQSKTER